MDLFVVIEHQLSMRGLFWRNALSGYNPLTVKAPLELLEETLLASSRLLVYAPKVSYERISSLISSHVEHI